MSDLIVHKDTARVPEEAVMSIDAPERTQTWNPMPHREVISTMNRVSEMAGLRIDKREYSMNEKGTKMFGLWTLEDRHKVFDDDHEGVFKCLGFRNSIDKSMSFGMCAGSRVFICDNLAMSGQFGAFRKHTGGLDDIDLSFIAADAMSTISLQWDTIASQTQNLISTAMKPYEEEAIVCKAVTDGIVPVSDIKGLLNLIEQYKTGSDERGMVSYARYLIMGAYTEQIREKRFDVIQERSSRMMDFLMEASWEVKS